MSTPSRSAYVISTQDIAPGWVVLYAVTFALQIVAVFVRFFLTFTLLWLLLKILGQSTAPVQVISQVIAWSNSMTVPYLTLISTVCKSSPACTAQVLAPSFPETVFAATQPPDWLRTMRTTL